VLVIRLQLYLTNYPQIGGKKLHIAHVLDGGLLMMIAIVVMLSFLPRGARLVGAVVGGIGFGFFIDELGKFITKDTDYFFKPTAALIYIIFILMYLSFRALQGRRGFTQAEYLANAIELLKEAALKDLDEREQRQALELLGKANPGDPLVEPLRELIAGLKPVPDRRPPWLARTATRLLSFYQRLTERAWFRTAMVIVFAAVAIASVALIAILVFFHGDTGSLSFINVADLVSSLATALLILTGIFELVVRDSRAAAYRMFDRSLLVAIFVGQVFAFAQSSFAAVYGLFVYLLLWVTLRYMMAAEGHLRRAEPATPSGP
jgi:hypothetical protein